MSDSFTSRVPVPTFTKTADGNIYMARGAQPGPRGDGLAARAGSLKCPREDSRWIDVSAIGAGEPTPLFSKKPGLKAGHDLFFPGHDLFSSRRKKSLPGS